MTSSLKSISAPFRYRYDFISHTILTPFDSSCSSLSAGASSTRSSMYENPEQPPPFTPTRRRVDSSGRPWSLMMDFTSLAALSLSVIGMGESPVLMGFFERQMLEGHVDSAPRKDHVRHADVLQKSDQFELQRLYRPLRAGDAGELQIIGCILQMFKATAIRLHRVGGAFHDFD